MKRLNFDNPRRGKQPRAAFWMRWSRQLRRKLVAWERAIVCDTAKLLQRQIVRMYAKAEQLDVPLPKMDPLPAIPVLPGQDWVEHRQAMGELRPVVKPANIPTNAPQSA